MSAKRVAQSKPVRTALTAVAIIGAGVITGTLLALTPLFDEVSTFSAPHFERDHSPVQSSGFLVPPPPNSAYPHHELRPHVVHGARAYVVPSHTLRASL